MHLAFLLAVIYTFFLYSFYSSTHNPPIITSSPSEDHTYSAGGLNGGGILIGSGNGTIIGVSNVGGANGIGGGGGIKRSSSTNNNNNSDNNSNGTSSDAAYESSEER